MRSIKRFAYLTIGNVESGRWIIVANTAEDIGELVTWIENMCLR